MRLRRRLAFGVSCAALAAVAIAATIGTIANSDEPDRVKTRAEAPAAKKQRPVTITTPTSAPDAPPPQGNAAPAAPIAAPDSVPVESEVASRAIPPNASLFTDDFSQADFGQWKCELEYQPVSCDATDGRITHAAPAWDVPRNGPAMRFHLPNTGGAHKTSIVPKGAHGSVNTFLNAQSWYGFSLYVPSTTAQYNQDSIVAQWANPNSAGAQDKRPPANLSVHDGRWWLQLNPGDGSSKTHDLGPVAGGWTDWVFAMDWTCGGGSIRVFRAGTEVDLQHTAPICIGLTEAPYLTLGINHPSWKNAPAGPSTLITFVDEVRVGFGMGDYATVAPR